VTLPGLLASARGRSVIITFWASWCEPCASEAAALERFSLSSPGRGRLVGVNWSDGLSGARSFVHRYSWTFSNVRDSEGTVGNEYRLTGLPTTFVLDASGRIRAVLRGPQDERSLARVLASVSHGRAVPATAELSRPRPSSRRPRPSRPSGMAVLTGYRATAAASS
jgi:thiol-disulfide isomerase/thioredoxin